MTSGGTSFRASVFSYSWPKQLPSVMCGADCDICSNNIQNDPLETAPRQN